MWFYLKWSFRISVALLVFLFLHYTLLQRDVVQITNTYNRLSNVGVNAIFYAAPDVGSADGVQRDIRFIDAVRLSGRVIVYRNEDTGWVWPPYFKYDSSNLQAEATALKSSDGAQKWAVVTHYGWRLAWLSIYPNAISVRAVDGPEVKLFPWLNIVILTTLAALILMLRTMWRQFRERSIDPVIEDAGEVWDRVDDHAAAATAAAADRARGVWGRFAAWIATWRGKPRQ